MHALLANADLLILAVAAVIAALVMATARGIAPLHSYLYLAVTTLIVSQHNWPLTSAAMAYGAVVATLQIRSARRRTATA